MLKGYEQVVVRYQKDITAEQERLGQHHEKYIALLESKLKERDEAYQLLEFQASQVLNEQKSQIDELLLQRSHPMVVQQRPEESKSMR